jgi:hypothetical protein
MSPWATTGHGGSLPSGAGADAAATSGSDTMGMAAATGASAGGDPLLGSEETQGRRYARAPRTDKPAPWAPSTRPPRRLGCRFRPFFRGGALPMRSRLTVVAVLCLAACAAPVETRRAVPGDLAGARSRITAELARLGFTPTSGGGPVIEATAATAPDDWASCGPTLVGGGGTDEARRMATAETERAAGRVELTPAGGGTEVDVATEFTGSYRNPITTYHFDRACRSNGVVESRLLTAAGA